MEKGEVTHPSFCDILDQFEGDDLSTKLAELRTVYDDINKKKSKGRAHKKEAIALKSRTKEFIELCLEFASRPQVTHMTWRMKLSVTSRRIMRQLLVLVTDIESETQDILEKVMELRDSFIDCVDGEMWTPDRMEEQQMEFIESKLEEMSWEVPAWKGISKSDDGIERNERRENTGLDTKIQEFEWPGRINLEADLAEEEEEEDDIDMDMEDRERGRARGDVWFKFDREYERSRSRGETGESASDDEEDEVEGEEEGEIDDEEEGEVEDEEEGEVEDEEEGGVDEEGVIDEEGVVDEENNLESTIGRLVSMNSRFNSEGQMAMARNMEQSREIRRDSRYQMWDPAELPSGYHPQPIAQDYYEDGYATDFEDYGMKVTGNGRHS